MAKNKDKAIESPPSRIKPVAPKNIEIVLKNPDLILQLQNRTKLLNQLQSRTKVADQFQNQMRMFHQPQSLIMAAESKNIKSFKMRSNPSFQFTFIKEHQAPIQFAYEKALGHFEGKNLIYQLTEYRELAKKTGSIKLDKKIGRLMSDLQTMKKPVLDFQIAEIEKIAKKGNPILSKEFANVKKTFDGFGGRIINEVTKVNKVKQITRLKDAAKGLKFAKGVGIGVSTFFDIQTLWEVYKKWRQNKVKGGDWVDAIISGASIIGTVFGGLALAGVATATLAPLAATIGGAALIAGLGKYAYDMLISDKALKSLPKQKHINFNIPRNPLETSGLLFPFKISRNARGTSYFNGGLSLVGEEGPELVNLPQGSQIFSHSRTQSLLNGMSNGNAGISVNYSPQIIIQGNADARVMKTASDNSFADFERKFNALMDRRRRLSFAGG